MYTKQLSKFQNLTITITLSKFDLFPTNFAHLNDPLIDQVLKRNFLDKNSMYSSDINI